MGQPVKISINPANATIELGGSVQLAVTCTDAEGNLQNLANPIIWVSSNPLLATVNADGLVSAYDPSDPNVLNTGGQATITATAAWADCPASGSTIYAEALVTVQATPAVTVYSRAQSQGATIAEAENWPSANLWSNGWKAVPQSLTD